MKAQTLVNFAAVALAAEIVATLANPSAYAADLIHVETDLIQKTASQYGASQTAVRAGQVYFSGVVAALDVLRATAPDTVRAVYKRLHAACVANNAPFIVQSRKAGLSVIVRAVTIAAPEPSESDKTAETDETPAATEAAPVVDERDAIIAEQAARIAELEAQVSALTLANVELTCKLDAVNKLQATPRKRSRVA